MRPARSTWGCRTWPRPRPRSAPWPPARAGSPRRGSPGSLRRARELRRTSAAWPPPGVRLGQVTLERQLPAPQLADPASEPAELHQIAVPVLTELGDRELELGLLELHLLVGQALAVGGRLHRRDRLLEGDAQLTEGRGRRLERVGDLEGEGARR